MPVWVGPQAFAEFYPSTTEDEVTARLGASGWKDMSESDALAFAGALDSLFADIQSRATDLRGRQRITSRFGGRELGWPLGDV